MHMQHGNFPFQVLDNALKGSNIGTTCQVFCSIYFIFKYGSLSYAKKVKIAKYRLDKAFPRILVFPTLLPLYQFLYWMFQNLHYQRIQRRLQLSYLKLPVASYPYHPFFLEIKRFRCNEKRYPPAHLTIHRRKKCSCKNRFDDSFHFSFSLCLLSLNEKNNRIFIFQREFRYSLEKTSN